MKIEIIVENNNAEKVISALKGININIKKNKPKLKIINNMVHIPSGSFMMGSPETEEERRGDERLHKVILTKDFYMGAYPVTQEEWEDLMGYNPIINCFKKFLNSTKDYDQFSKIIGLKKPVVYITWDNAKEYCKRLTKQEQKKGNIPINWHYCLPTEAQWEYACRAGSQGKYYNGYTNLDDIAWYDKNSNNNLQIVGQKKPNAWELYDMIGNVWEWCFDWADNYSSNTIKNPTGPNFGVYRITRGGAYDFDHRCCCARRDHCNPTTKFVNEGFRIVLTTRF